MTTIKWLYASQQQRRRYWLLIMLIPLPILGPGIIMLLADDRSVARIGLTMTAVAAMAMSTCLLLAVAAQDKSRALRRLEALAPTAGPTDSWFRHYRAAGQEGDALLTISNDVLYVGNYGKEFANVLITAHERQHLLAMIEHGMYRSVIKRFHRVAFNEVLSIESWNTNQLVVNTADDVFTIVVFERAEEVARELATKILPGSIGSMATHQDWSDTGLFAKLVSPDTHRLIFHRSNVGIQPNDRELASEPPTDPVVASLTDRSFKRRWKGVLLSWAILFVLIYFLFDATLAMVRDLGPTQEVNAVVDDLYIDTRTTNNGEQRDHIVAGRAANDAPFSFESRRLWDAMDSVPQTVTLGVAVTGEIQYVRYASETYGPSKVALGVVTILLVACWVVIAIVLVLYWHSTLRLVVFGMMMLVPLALWAAWAGHTPADDLIYKPELSSSSS